MKIPWVLTYDRLILVWAFIADKDIRSTLLEVAPLAAAVIFTWPESERSAQPDALRSLLPEKLRNRISIHCTDSVAEAIQLATAQAGTEDLVCVAGSLYLIGKARQLLIGELAN